MAKETSWAVKRKRISLSSKTTAASRLATSMTVTSDLVPHVGREARTVQLRRTEGISYPNHEETLIIMLIISIRTTSLPMSRILHLTCTCNSRTGRYYLSDHQSYSYERKQRAYQAHSNLGTASSQGGGGPLNNMAAIYNQRPAAKPSG